MTYPLIGNYGVTPLDEESRNPWISGLIVREICDVASNWRSEGLLADYLAAHDIPGISGIDTRALTRHIRSSGDIRAVLVRNAAGLSDEELVERAKQAPLPGESNVVDIVAGDEIERLGDENGPHVVVVDCGVKRNIVRSLVQRNARVTIVPYGTPFTDIAALEPDGVIFSPGPGDPANLDSGLDVVRSVLDAELPYFGICLGHQLLARAIGADTSKLLFGHRGGNQPVRDERTGKVTITAQNHSFQVLADTLPQGDEWQAALINLNDGSVEGLAHRERPVISVQFHPEASPGPHDNSYLFDRFLDMIATGQQTPAVETR
jgi:carbamoyl-phosphate synthase small subunit